MKFTDFMYYILCHKRLRYLLLIPILLLIYNSWYMQRLTEGIQDTMLRQKLLEVTDEVNMIASSCLCEDNVKLSTGFLDEMPLVYSSTYKNIDGTLERVSERNNETSFDPLLYPEFSDTVLAQDSGNIVLGFTPEGQPYRDLYMYFRWIPTEDGQRLAVAGVSEYSIITEISVLVSVGPLVNTALFFLLSIVIVLWLAFLGHIHEQRGGECKWRGGDYDA